MASSPSPTNSEREYYIELTQLASKSPKLFPGFNCGYLESIPQSDLPADWIVRRFDNDDAAGKTFRFSRAGRESWTI